MKKRGAQRPRAIVETRDEQRDEEIVRVHAAEKPREVLRAGEKRGARGRTSDHGRDGRRGGRRDDESGASQRRAVGRSVRRDGSRTVRGTRPVRSRRRRVIVQPARDDDPLLARGRTRARAVRRFRRTPHLASSTPRGIHGRRLRVDGRRGAVRREIIQHDASNDPAKGREVVLVRRHGEHGRTRRTRRTRRARGGVEGGTHGVTRDGSRGVTRGGVLLRVVVAGVCALEESRARGGECRQTRGVRDANALLAVSRQPRQARPHELRKHLGV